MVLKHQVNSDEKRTGVLGPHYVTTIAQTHSSFILRRNHLQCYEP